MAVQGITMPAPYGGLDLVSPIDQMEPFRALELINIIPESSAPVLRKGYQEFADTLEGVTVQTVATMPLVNGDFELIVSADDKVFKVNSSGVLTDLGITITNSAWQTEVYSNRLYMANGSDTVKVYNSLTGTIADCTYTGVNKDDLINVSSYKNRVYFVEKESANLWYGKVNTVGSNSVTLEDLSFAFTKGGFLVFGGSYTNQTAQTSADLFLAVSSEGEVLAYAGDDPTNWSIVARYFIGKPLGYRAFIRVNQDVWILTEQGIVPVGALFQADPEQANQTVSRLVNPLISAAAQTLSFSPRWQGSFFPAGRRVYVQVPYSNSKAYLLVFSLSTGAWTKFHQDDDGDCLSLAIANGNPYYGSANGKVFQAEHEYADNSQPINWKIETAFSFYGTRGNYKAFKDVRPLLKTIRGTGLKVGLSTDFKRIAPFETITTSSGGTYTHWSAAGSVAGDPGFTPWGSNWSSSVDYIYDRFATKGQGHCASITLAGEYKDKPLDLFGFEIRFDVGGQV